MKKIYKKIKIRDYNCLLSERKKEFILSIKISRLFNAIMFPLRVFYDNHQRKDVLESIKNRLDILIQLSSTIYEVIKTYKKDIESEINLDLLDDKTTKIYIELKKKHDYKNPNQYDKILKTIRNKIAFHFDDKILNKYIENKTFKQNDILFIGFSEKTKDTFFCASDDVILDYLEKEFSKNSLEFDFYSFERDICNLAIKLKEYFELLITDMLEGYYYKIEEHL